MSMHSKPEQLNDILQSMDRNQLLGRAAAGYHLAFAIGYELSSNVLLSKMDVSNALQKIRSTAMENIQSDQSLGALTAKECEQFQIGVSEVLQILGGAATS